MLIYKNDFKPYVDIAANLSDDKLRPRILEASNFDLCGLMGESFYYKFLSYIQNYQVVDEAPQAYKDIYNGSTYTVAGVSYIHEGVKPVVVYFSAARLLHQLDLHITPNGIKTKRNEFSDDADPRLVGRTATGYENLAIAYWNKCKAFIEYSGKDNFPLWHGFKSCSVEFTGSRPRMIGVKGRGTNPNGFNYGR